MEVQCPPLGRPHFCQGEEMEELSLRHTLLCTSVELESTIVSAKEEIARREVEMLQIRDMLSKAIKERDEAQAQCQNLLLHNLFLQQQNHLEIPNITTPLSEAYSSESLDDDTKESHDDFNTKQPPLPEKGKLLQAVMEAGPLLKTLLLAGPLPEWQHPPPKLDTIEIPPVSISSSPTTPLVGLNGLTRKRGPVPLCHDSGPSPNTKLPKLVLH